MYCNNCGNFLEDEHLFCTHCGAARPEIVSGPKGTRWVPLLILTLMIVLGCVVYYFSITNSLADKTPALSIRHGSLYFDESKHDGDPVLVVPDVVDGQSVNSIGEYCFSACDSLTSITLPNTVEQISSNAFFDCENLNTVKLSHGITIIGHQVFFSCDNLDTIYIPSSVEYIAPYAFDNCNRLKHIYFDGTAEDWSHIGYTEINPSVQVHFGSTD